MNYLMFIAFLITILTINSVLIHVHVKKSSKLIETFLNKITATDVPFSDVKEQLTSYELELIAREAEFDNRINQLREDVLKGVQADELHPLVHNLPHNAVQTRYDLSTYEEVAE